jgi:hypothetical protein
VGYCAACTIDVSCIYQVFYNFQLQTIFHLV